MVRPGSRLKVGLFLAALALPLFEQNLRLLPRVGLAGEEAAAEKVRLTPRSWWSGQFQAAYDPWFSRRLRVRGWLVRADNQVGLTVFRQPPGSGTPIVLGREGVLFEKAYVDEYNRPRQVSARGIARIAGGLARLDGLLRRRGARLVVVVAPSKVEIYPDLLPARHVAGGRDRRRSQYQRLAPALRRSGVAFVDGYRILARERRRGNAPLYAKGGTHWNHYANALLAARLLKVLEREAPGRFVQIRVAGSRTDGTVWATDDDLGSLMNVFWPRPWPGPQTHPVFARRAGGRIRPRLLFTGDSFSLQFLEFMTAEGLMEPGESLFYFNRRVRAPGAVAVPLDRGSFDASREVAGKDAVVLVMSTYYLVDHGFGFVEAATRALEQEGVAGGG